MDKARLTSKGQITVPKHVRERLGLRTGDEIEFVEDGGVIRIQKRIPESPFEKWRGYLQEFAGADPDALIEEMRGR